MYIYVYIYIHVFIPQTAIAAGAYYYHSIEVLFLISGFPVAA